MQLINQIIPLDHNLFLFGDDHEGNSLRHKDGWKTLIDMLHSEYDGCSNNFGVDHGDCIEAITVDDYRWDFETQESLVLEQIDRAIENRIPISDMLVALLDGNHPQKLWRFGDITRRVADKLKVQYGTYSAHITYTSTKGRTLYRHYATHGSKSITSTADDPLRRRTNMGLILKRHLKFKFGDCALASKGHTHKLIVVEPIKELFLTGGPRIRQHYTGSQQAGDYIHPDHRWYVNTGSFLRLLGDGVSGYAERAEYDPIELGFAIVVVRDGVIQRIDKILLESPKDQGLNSPKDQESNSTEDQ